MSWRTVVISQRCKLDSKMGYMVVRGHETQRIFMDEIAVLVIENPAVSLTGCLLETLSEKKIKVIFCDKTRSPYAELTPLYGCFDCSRKLKQQIGWSSNTKGYIWSAIIAEKIDKQAGHLFDCGKAKEASQLLSYIPQIEYHDATNREGHSAKVYFNALFGKGFKRSDKNDPTNIALNYGYSILLSAFNRCIVSNGYSTQIGIHHDNVFNHYNLSSDIMEPYRILVDRIVAKREIKEFDKELRYSIIDVLNSHVLINSTRQTVLNAIDIYTKSVILALNESDASLIRFYDL